MKDASTSIPALAPGLTTQRTAAYSPLKPSRALTKCHGVDIVKRNAARKGKLLLAFPGVFHLSPTASSLSAPPALPGDSSSSQSTLQAVDVGRLGVLRNIESHTPSLYLEFPQGRLKMEGEVLFPKKNRFVTLQFPSNAKSVLCQDVFDRVVTFPRVYWIGDAASNPQEAPLPMPPDIAVAPAPLASAPWGPPVGVRPEEVEDEGKPARRTRSPAKRKMTPRHKPRTQRRQTRSSASSEETTASEAEEEPGDDEDEEEEEEEEEEEYAAPTPTPTPTLTQSQRQRATPPRVASQRARRQLLDVMASNAVASDSSDLEIVDGEDEDDAPAADAKEPEVEDAPSPQRSPEAVSTPQTRGRRQRRTPESTKSTARQTPRKRSRAPEETSSIESGENVTPAPTPSRSKRRMTPQTTPLVTPTRQRTPTRTKMAIDKLLSSGGEAARRSEDETDEVVDLVLATPSRVRRGQPSSAATRRGKRRSTTPSTETSRPSIRNASRRTTPQTSDAQKTPAPAPAAGPNPSPVPNTYAVPAPSAVPGSKTFAYVKNVQCTDEVAKTSFSIYSKNRALFDQCVVEGRYQIFPYSGSLPTQQQIMTMVKSSSCRAVFSACVLANLPQCDIGGLALKSVTETLLKIAIDVDNGMEAPSSEKLFELLCWRRDVNLAQVNGLPYDQDSQLYAEYSRNLWKALTRTDVQVQPDLTITVSMNGTIVKPDGQVFAKVSTGSDASDIVGRVQAGSTGGSFSGATVTLPTHSAAPSVCSAWWCSLVACAALLQLLVL
ncbi:hypothetical protein ATCC90586_005717 [Pythium insidiosum]|nr:hypothetical protein ATCC90586_005717 [Pythium insidiosum]